MGRHALKKMSQLNNGELIEKVKRQPALYDPEHTLYRDVEKSNGIWATIGSTWNLNAEECKLKWKSLRDTFVKKKRLLKSRNNVDVIKAKQWKHLKAFSFLDPFVQFKSQQDVADDEYHGDEETEPLVGNESMSVGEDDSVKVNNHDEDTNTIDTTEDNNSNTYTSLQPFAQSKKLDVSLTQGQEQIPQDEDEHFMLSQLATLRRLPPAPRSLAKFKIHEILFQIENNLYQTNAAAHSGQAQPHVAQIQASGQPCPANILTNAHTVNSVQTQAVYTYAQSYT